MIIYRKKKEKTDIVRSNIRLRVRQVFFNVDIRFSKFQLSLVFPIIEDIQNDCSDRCYLGA